MSKGSSLIHRVNTEWLHYLQLLTASCRQQPPFSVDVGCHGDVLGVSQSSSWPLEVLFTCPSADQVCYQPPCGCYGEVQSAALLLEQAVMVTLISIFNEVQPAPDSVLMLHIAAAGLYNISDKHRLSHYWDFISSSVLHFATITFPL